MTNKEKFREVFGFKPRNVTCPMPRKVCEMNGFICDECTVADWWNKEYMECFQLKEDLDGN